MKVQYAIVPTVLSVMPALSCHAAVDKSVAQKKNVLFIIVDDLKPVLGCYGDSFVKTPNIDRLAGHGTIFSSAYCQQALSGPSRCSILTGLRPDNLRIYGMNMLRQFYKDPLTLPEYFRHQGYETLAIGKVFDHRTVDSARDYNSWSVPYLIPPKEEFWQSRKTTAGYRDKKTAEAIKESTAEAQRMGLKGSAVSRYSKQHSQYTTECMDVPDNGYNDGAFASVAVKEIEKLAESGKPFFFAVGFHKPHLPFIAPKKYWDMYDRDSVPLAEFHSEPENAVPASFSPYKEILDWVDMPGAYQYQDSTRHTIAIDIDKQKELIHGYYACVSYMDAQVGKLLDVLERTGLDSNTVVVLVGDHGWHLGDHGLWAKHTNFEQAVHAPLIISVPGNGHVSCNDAVEFVDIFPTLCSEAGLQIPEHLDGRDLSRIISGGKMEPRLAVSQFPREKNVMGYTLRSGEYRYTVWLKNSIPALDAVTDEVVIGEELYDYGKDPLETRNFAVDKSYRKILDDMRDEFLSFFNEQKSSSAYHKGHWIAGKQYFNGIQDEKSAKIMSSVADSIDKYRKGTYDIEIVDAETGIPIDGEARFNLSRHKFKFGVSMYGVSSLKDSVLKESAETAIKEIFNTVTVCDYFKQGSLSGDPMLESAAKDIEFAMENGKNMRFHTALFNVPQWIDGKNYSEQQCWDLIESRLKYISENYSGQQFEEYDIINEFLSEYRFRKRKFYDNNPGYPQFRHPETAKKVLDMAREYLPGKKFVVLETTLASVKNPVYCEIVDFYKKLAEVGGDFDYVGYQGHFYAAGDYRQGDKRYGEDAFTMGAVSDALDMLGEVGKPVVITEFNGPSRRRNVDGSDEYPSWTLSDEENADWQINFYRLAFSKPYVHEITRWFLVDGLGGTGLDAGVIDKDGHKKAIYDKLNHLINEEWDTDVTVPVKEGKAAFRGFFGKYRVCMPGYKPVDVDLDGRGQYVIRLVKE